MPELPPLDSDYDVTPEQVEQYRRDGHILLRQVCSPAEVAAYRPCMGAIVEDHAKAQGDLGDRDTYGKAFLQIGNLWKRDEAVKRFVFARRFARIAARLAGVEAIRLYHDQALYKEGGGGFTPWHQDQFYWPLETRESLTLWMPMVDATQEMGTMRFASRSHRDGYLGDLAISDTSEAYFNDYVESHGFSIFSCGDMRAGDATFHNGWTLHRADPNTTDRLREAMTIIFYPDGTKLSRPDNAGQSADFEAFYPDMNPGELAANELTPVLYSESQ